jgi:hypothetical protein
MYVALLLLRTGSVEAAGLVAAIHYRFVEAIAQQPPKIEFLGAAGNMSRLYKSLSTNHFCSSSSNFCNYNFLHFQSAEVQ